MADRSLIDTGPIVALYSEDDAHRERCGAALNQLTPPLLTCWPVLTEVAWLLRKRPDALQRVIAGFAGGLFALLTLDDDDLGRAVVLPGDDVIDRMGQRRDGLRELAVFATRVGALPDQSLKREIHAWRPCRLV